MSIDIESHLESRHIDACRYSGVWIGDETATFALWNLSGQLVGFQQYRPFADKKKKNHPRDGRYFTFVAKEDRISKISVWGLESLAYAPDVVILCEGIFDACRFHRFNVPAIAILGSSAAPIREWLHSTGRKAFQAPDATGSRLGPYSVVSIPDGRDDVGECSDSEIQQMISTMTFKRNTKC